LRLPPLSQPEAREMVESLRGAPILRGVRGAPPADLDALVDALRRFAQLALDLNGLVEAIDVNPLIVFEAGKGVKALDCLIGPRADQGPAETN